jgi:hypothetical protein
MENTEAPFFFARAAHVSAVQPELSYTPLTILNPAIGTTRTLLSVKQPT